MSGGNVQRTDLQRGARVENVVEQHRAVTAVKRKPTSSARKFVYILSAATVGAAAVVGFNYARDAWSQRDVPDTVSSGQFHEFTSPGAYKIPFEDLTLKGANGTKLKAWLFKAKPESPTLVYLHGQKADAAWMLPQLAQLYKQTECNMLVLNYRNCRLGHTEGDMKNALADVSAAINNLRDAEDSPINGRKVVLLGSGTGAQVAVDVAAKLGPNKVAGMILENPRQGVPVRELSTSLVETFRYVVPNWLRNLATRMAPSATEQLSKSSLPVMFVADENFSQNVAKQWFMKCGSPDRMLLTGGYPNKLRDTEWTEFMPSFIESIAKKEPLGVQVRTF